MKSKKAQYYDQAMAAIKKHNLCLIEDVVAWLPIDRRQFTRLFPPTSADGIKLREAIEDNKVSTKAKLRRKLLGSDSPTALIALYRLVCTPEERRALSSTSTDITTGGKPLQQALSVEIIDNRSQVDCEEGGGQ